MPEPAAPTPRKRGRPPKEGGPKVKPVVLDENGQPRKRGRPRKYPPGESPKPKTNTGRGRGRPRKSEGSCMSTVNGTAAVAVGATNLAGKSRGSDPESANFHMDNIRGTYSLQCEEVERNWPDTAKHMQMKIVEQEHGFAARFDLGILTGIMLFAPDKKSLDKFVALKSEAENIGGAGRGADDDDAEGEDDSDDKARKPPAKRARRNMSYNATPPVLKTRRVLFKWRGREESTGEIHSSSLDGNEGYLEFEDGDATKFVGFSGFPAMGSNCKFTGTKTGGSKGPIGIAWTEFSQEAASRAASGWWK